MNRHASRITHHVARVGVDLRGLTQKPMGGIARAAKELWETWQKDFSDAELVGFFEGNAWTLRKQILASGVDRLFCPTGAVPPFCPVPAVPWVHDLAIFDHPEWFPQNILRRKMTTSLVLRGIRKATTVLAVSEDTKEAIVRIAGIEAGRIEVTYQGVVCRPESDEGPHSDGMRFFTPFRMTQQNYALILGTVEPRKQPSWVASWWEEVNCSVGLDLVVAGPTGWGGEEARLQTVAGKASWFQRVHEVDETTKTELIKNAACVLVPSLHEGFGRVALEAMALGTPVIASDRGALPEVVGDGGRLLDPMDPEGWIRTIREVVDSEAVRRGLVEAGHRQALRFSWPKIAQGMLASLFAS